jgi:glutathione S-transferase
LKWLPTDEAAMDDALACIATNDGHFKLALDRYKYPTRFGLSDGQAPRAEGCQGLQAWEQRLQQQAFLGGAVWGLVDAAIAPFVRQYAHTDEPWFATQDWPHLQLWLQAFEDSAAFAAVMQKEAVWAAGNAPRLTRFAPPAAP